MSNPNQLEAAEERLIKAGNAMVRAADSIAQGSGEIDLDWRRTLHEFSREWNEALQAYEIAKDPR